MIQDIIAGILCVIAVAAGIWGYRVENGGTLKNEKIRNESEENRDEKN